MAEVDAAVDGEELATIVDNVARASARTEELTAELLAMSRNLGAAAVSADSTLRRMAAVAGAIEQGEGTLGMLVRDPDLYVRMVESTQAVEALLRDIRENPRRYITVRIF
jgi:phospholipid/cholesterol/gamma-HCH transport system substrate-binding protein